MNSLQNFNRLHEIYIQVLLEDIKICHKAAFLFMQTLCLSALVAVPQRAQLLQGLRLLFVKPERRCDKLAYHSALVFGNALAKNVVH